MKKSKVRGLIKLSIEHDNGKKEFIEFENDTVLTGKIALAKSLIKDEPKIYITSVVFGDGGVENENQANKEVPFNRNSLYGITRLTKPILPQIDLENPNSIIMVFSIEKNECNDYTINEMGIKLSDGNLFSMATFKNIYKDNTMRFSWTWILEF